MAAAGGLDLAAAGGPDMPAAAGGLGMAAAAGGHGMAAAAGGLGMAGQSPEVQHEAINLLLNIECYSCLKTPAEERSLDEGADG